MPRQARPSAAAPTGSVPGSQAPVCPAGEENDLLWSNRNFPNFIGFWPIFQSAWVKTPGALPNANFQVYGAGLNLALTERLCVGLNQGGFAVMHIDSGRFLGREFGGQRDGFLNLGGFAQYTLIEDVPNQFLLTACLRY